MEENAASVASVRPDASMRALYASQSLPLGILAGAVVALVCACLWAAITVATEYQIGYLAVAVGFAVGFTVRWAGKGVTTAFGVVGAILALLGCVIGNFLSVIGFFSVQEQVSFVEILLSFDYLLLPQLMIETFEPIDLLFYGLAIYTGYRSGFHKIDA